MQMQPNELQQLQECIAQLEQENAAFQAEVAALRQRELALQDQVTGAQDRAAELTTLNAALRAKILLLQQTKNALIESDHCFRRAFEQAAIGMTITDLEGRWVQINQCSCDMLGYTNSELRSLTCADLTHPDTLADDLRFGATLSHRRTVCLPNREALPSQRWLLALGKPNHFTRPRCQGKPSLPDFRYTRHRPA